MKQVNDQPSGNLPFLKPDDIQYFDKLLVSLLLFAALLSFVLLFSYDGDGGNVGLT